MFRPSVRLRRPRRPLRLLPSTYARGRDSSPVLRTGNSRYADHRRVPTCPTPPHWRLSFAVISILKLTPKTLPLRSSLKPMSGGRVWGCLFHMLPSTCLPGKPLLVEMNRLVFTLSFVKVCYNPCWTCHTCHVSRSVSYVVACYTLCLSCVLGDGS